MVWILAAAGIFALIGSLYVWTSPGLTGWRQDRKRRRRLSAGKRSRVTQVTFFDRLWTPGSWGGGDGGGGGFGDGDGGGGDGGGDGGGGCD